MMPGASDVIFFSGPLPDHDTDPCLNCSCAHRAYDCRCTNESGAVMKYHKYNPVPRLGLGATIVWWTDRTAATVVTVSSNRKRIRLRRCRSVRTDSNGVSEMQAYAYIDDLPDEDGVWFSLRKNGRWVKEGSDMFSGQACELGVRMTYHDYSF